MASRFLRSAADDPANRTCTIYYVQRELGEQHLSEKRLCAYLRKLIAEYGFPKPLPTVMRGGSLTNDVHQRSKWIRAAVDAWIDGYIPPDCAATIDEKAMRAAAAEMDANAQNLRLVGGRDYRGGRHG